MMMSMPEAVDPAILPVRSAGPTTVPRVKPNKRNIGATASMKRDLGSDLVAELEKLVANRALVTVAGVPPRAMTYSRVAARASR